MSTSDTSGFGKFVPGFDFLQNLAKNASSSISGLGGSASMPNLSQWLVPSLNVEDLEKRIEELKHVQFWLEQNSRALAATIQALEVQKLTMATLKGMNFTMGTPASAPEKTQSPAASGWPMPPTAPESAQSARSAKAPPAAPAAIAPEPADTIPTGKPAAGVVDPLQLWGALTQQFQTIAANAFKEVSETAAAAPVAGKKPVARKAPAKKASAQPTPAKKAAAVRRKSS